MKQLLFQSQDEVSRRIHSKEISLVEVTDLIPELLNSVTNECSV